MCEYCEVQSYYDEFEEEYTFEDANFLTYGGTVEILMGLTPEMKIGIWPWEDNCPENVKIFYPKFCPVCGRRIIENE